MCRNSKWFDIGLKYHVEEYVKLRNISYLDSEQALMEAEGCVNVSRYIVYSINSLNVVKKLG